MPVLESSDLCRQIGFMFHYKRRSKYVQLEQKNYENSALKNVMRKSWWEIFGRKNWWEIFRRVFGGKFLEDKYGGKCLENKFGGKFSEGFLVGNLCQFISKLSFKMV